MAGFVSQRVDDQTLTVDVAGGSWSKLNLPVLALSIGSFGIGVTEFAPMGLLPNIATDLDVTIPVAGMLVTGYAMGVTITAPIVTMMTGRMPRKALMVFLMLLFVVGNLISAVAGGYDLLMFGRLVTALCHGTFFGVGAIIAAELVAPNKRAGAVATVFMGLTLANVVGVPLATWLGQVAGWRWAFWGITGLGLVATAAIAGSLPRLPMHKAIRFRDELRVVCRPSVLLAMTMTVLSSAAMFTVFTYIATILTDTTKASGTFVTCMLALYGVGLTVGNWVGGWAADKSLDGTLIAGLASVAGLLLLFAVVMPWHVPTAIFIFAWGVASFALVSPLQIRVMKDAADAPAVASALNIGAFNFGNAIGAAVGGGVVFLGLGNPAISIAGAALAATALAIAVATRKRSVAAESAETADATPSNLDCVPCRC